MTREDAIARALDEWRTVSERHRERLVFGLAHVADPSVRQRIEATLDEILADRERLSEES